MPRNLILKTDAAVRCAAGAVCSCDPLPDAVLTFHSCARLESICALRQWSADVYLMDTPAPPTIHHGQGFDEYMNVVLDDAEEVSIKSKERKVIGRIMLKGDNIT